MAASDQLVETLRALQSNDNNVRSAAEKCFEESKKQQAALTIASLFQVLVHQQLEEPVREQAAVLLRQCLNNATEEGSTWCQLGAAGQSQCKSQLLLLLESAAMTKSVRRKIADAVQHLGNQLVDIPMDERPQNVEAWQELVPSLLKIVMDSSKDGCLRADALWAVKELLTSLWPVMVANGQQTAQVLQVALTDTGSEAVRASGAVLFCEFVDMLGFVPEARPAFMPLIEPLTAVLRQLAESVESTLLNEVLQALQGTEASADFFKANVATHLLPLLVAIAKSHKEEDTQRLALEVVITFAESRPKAMSKVAGFVEQTLDLCAHFLFQAKDDTEAWAQEEDDDEADDEEENFDAGKEALDRLCRCMHKADKFPQVLEVLKPAIMALLQATDWKRIDAGVAVLSTIAEYVDDEDTVRQMIGAIKPHLRSAHPRVRHCAWVAVAEFAEDHSDFVTSDAVASELLLEYVAGLDEPVPRVLQSCMAAFQHFGENLERELLEPVLQAMMEKLGRLLQSPRVAIQKRTITFIAVVAGQVQDGFAPYYGALMPVLKQLVQTVLHKAEERELLGKLFECISLLAKAAGPGGFHSDAEQIMQAMVQATQVPNLASDDPVMEYMMCASQRICASMKGDFLPFVPHILPLILGKVSFDTLKECNESIVDNFDEDPDVGIALVQSGGQVKVLVMHNSEMEELKGALECVQTFVQSLGKLYAPFVAQTAQSLQPVFDFAMREDIRDTAFETWGELCHVAREGGETQILGQLFEEFLKRVLPKLGGDAAILDLEAQKTCADGVTVCLKKAGAGILNSEQVRQISQVAFKTLEESMKRREADKQKSSKKAANVADEDEDVEDDEETEAELRTACCHVVGALMQHHPDIAVAELLQQCMSLVLLFFPASAPEEDRVMAYGLVCEMLSHLGTRVTGQWPQFMPQLLQDLASASVELRQSACWGASLAAKDPAFAAFALDTAKQLAEIVVQSRGRTKKKSEKPAQACADNALSALVEILVNHPQVVGGAEAQLWGVWLQGMPCQEDDTEGQKNHKMLLELVQAERPQVLGEGGANLQQIMSILVEVYKTPMVDDATSAGIGQLCIKLGGSFEQCAGKLKEKQQKKAQRIVREAQQRVVVA